jgi:hypothetical protein
MNKRIQLLKISNSLKNIAFHHPKKKIQFENQIRKMKYKDPSFFNIKNIESEKNSLINIFNKNKYKSKSQNSILNYDNSNLPSIITDKSLNIIDNTTRNKNLDDLKYYDKVFSITKLWTNKTKIINNLLNIRYAENEKQYLELAEKENMKRFQEGKLIKHFSLPKFTENKINLIKVKLKFIKSIEDFTLPRFITEKNKALSNEIKRNRKQFIYISPSHRRLLNNKKHESERNLFLKKSIEINNNLKKEIK